MDIRKPIRRTNIKTIKKFLNKTILHNHPQYNLEVNKKQLLTKDYFIQQDTNPNPNLPICFTFSIFYSDTIQQLLF